MEKKIHLFSPTVVGNDMLFRLTETWKEEKLIEVLEISPPHLDGLPRTSTMPLIDRFALKTTDYIMIVLLRRGNCMRHVSYCSPGIFLCLRVLVDTIWTCETLASCPTSPFRVPAIATT